MADGVRKLENGGAFKYMLLLPAVIWVIAFTFMPLFAVLRYSFASYVLGRGITGYVGFANYVDVLTSDQFWHSIFVTVVYVVVAVPIRGEEPVFDEPSGRWHNVLAGIEPWLGGYRPCVFERR